MRPTSVRRAGLRAVRAGAVSLALCAGCSTGRAPAAEAPRAGPLDVRVTELSPEAVDRIADAVAARLGGRAPPAAADHPWVRRPPPEVVPPPVIVRPPVAVPVRPVVPVAPVAPAAPLTDAEVAGLRDGVDRALDWLARHQSPSGMWSASGFTAQCKESMCGGTGEAAYDVGVTGLAVLAFHGAGAAAQSGPHADVVRRALAALRQNQDSEGCIGPRTSQHFIYNHGYAAFALVETYGATQSASLKTSAQSAVNFVLQAQNPYLGWRYGVRDGDNDTSVTGLMLHVLQSAKSAGLVVDETAIRNGFTWLDKMTEPEFGRVGYQQRGGPPARTTEAQARFPAAFSESLTAVATSARLAVPGAASGSDSATKGLALIAAKPPVWDEASGTIDLYYWHWGTLAMRRAGGAQWDAWRAHLVRALLRGQRGEGGGDARGSWDPADPWGAEGGRVYATAVAALAAEVAVRP